MSSLPVSAELARARAHLAPYARALLARCAAYAVSLHADEIGPEHLLSTLMDDEDCAAHRAVLHAFADPESISEEARAMSSGIMVTGSSCSLPFSARGVRALERAREMAAQRADAWVEPTHLVLAAAGELPDELFSSLESAGWNPARSEEGTGAGAAPASAPAGTRPSGSLFRNYSDAAKRVLSAAARVARTGSARAISPAHLLLAALQSESALEAVAGLSAARARLVLRGRSEDPTPAEPRSLAPDPALVGFLDGAAEGSSTLALLGRFHAGGTPELSQLLARHKVTPALIERCRGAFVDPEGPFEGSPEKFETGGADAYGQMHSVDES